MSIPYLCLSFWFTCNFLYLSQHHYTNISIARLESIQVYFFLLIFESNCILINNLSRMEEMTSGCLVSFISRATQVRYVGVFSNVMGDTCELTSGTYIFVLFFFRKSSQRFTISFHDFHASLNR